MLRYLSGAMAPKRPERLDRKDMIKDKKERGLIYGKTKREVQHNVNVYFRTSKTSTGLIKFRF